jgi:uncharacterized protein (UPF0548 family)
MVSRRLGPFTMLAPCRIVYVTEQATRFGFGDGTLPGHPERGEEAFHVVRADDGVITAEIVAFPDRTFAPSLAGRPSSDPPEGSRRSLQLRCRLPPQ